MAASDSIPVPRKNIAFRFYFAIRKPSDSTLITTWAGMDSEVSLDGAAFADCTNEATEIGTSGVGYIDMTAAEMNADSVVLKITVTNTGAVPLVFTFCPESAGDYRLAATPPTAAEVSTQVAFDLAAAHGAGSWATATGFSTHSAADVWSIGTRTITGGSLTTSPPTAAVIADAVWDEARSGHVTAGTFGEKVAAELDSASRLAIWNELTTQSFTADSFGELLIISDGTNGREVKVTGANHIAADVHEVQPDGLSGSTEITNIQNASGYLLAVLAGECADPQTASETYAITVFGSTFTVDMAGQTSTGTRTAPTLTKV